MTNTSNTHVLAACMQRAYARSKSEFYILISIQFFVGVLGLVGAFYAPVAMFVAYPCFVILLAAITLGLQMLVIKDTDSAEALKRLHERYENFGITPDGLQVAAACRGFGTELSTRAQKELTEGRTFASGEPYGARRALENLRESSFHSSDQCKLCAYFVFGAATMISLVAVLSLVFYLPSVKEVEGTVLSQSISAIISLFVSSGLLTAGWQFWRMGRSAEHATSEAINLLKKSDVTEVEASGAWQEYQVARSIAPSVPDFVWRLRHDHNNKAYDILIRG